MQDLNSQANPAISLAARLSAMGGIYDPANRRASFGASKISLEEVKGEGGMIDKALAFTQPSLLPLLNPIKLEAHKNSLHFRDVDPSFAESNVDLHAKCYSLLAEQAEATKLKVTKSLLDIKEDEFASIVKSMQKDDSSMTESQCALVIACDHMGEAFRSSLEFTQSMLNLSMREFVLPMLDKVHENERKDAFRLLTRVSLL